MKTEQIEAYRALVQQAYVLFGSHHYSHYDFLYSLSDQIQQPGLEHHQSSENGTDPEAFTEWDKTASDRDLLPHEFTHSWNGKFRRPADLWTPNYNVPMQDSLLWVYEGQTEYWGEVLAARSGLRTHQQALHQLGLTAAFYQLAALRGLLRRRRPHLARCRYVDTRTVQGQTLARRFCARILRHPQRQLRHRHLHLR